MANWWMARRVGHGLISSLGPRAWARDAVWSRSGKGSMGGVGEGDWRRRRKGSPERGGAGVQAAHRRSGWAGAPRERGECSDRVEPSLARHSRRDVYSELKNSRRSWLKSHHPRGVRRSKEEDFVAVTRVDVDTDQHCQDRPMATGLHPHQDQPGLLFDPRRGCDTPVDGLANLLGGISLRMSR